MKQRISTACDSNRSNPVAEATARVDTGYSMDPMQREASLPGVAYPGQPPDPSAREIAVKARMAMSAACEPEVGDWPISPFDQDGYSTFFESGPAMLTVLCVAVQVEPDPIEAGFWYRRTRIAELDDLTASQLVGLGRVEEVVGFLVSVRDGGRD